MARVSNESAQQISEKIHVTLMPQMFNLTDVFELVAYRFDDGPFAQEDLIHLAHELVSQVLVTFGNQFQALLVELFKPGLRDISRWF